MRAARQSSYPVGDERVGIVRAETADSLAVVGILLCGDVGVGELSAGGDVQAFRDVELIFSIGLVGVGPESLVEIGQSLISPIVKRVGRELIAVCVSPLVPDTSTKDPEPGSLTKLRGLAIFAIAVVLVDGARDGVDALLGHWNVAGSDREAKRRVDLACERSIIRDRGRVGIPFGIVVVIRERLHI